MRTWILLLFCLAVVVALAHAERRRPSQDNDDGKKEVQNKSAERGRGNGKKKKDRPSKERKATGRKKKGRKSAKKNGDKRSGKTNGKKSTARGNNRRKPGVKLNGKRPNRNKTNDKRKLVTKGGNTAKRHRKGKPNGEKTKRKPKKKRVNKGGNKKSSDRLARIKVRGRKLKKCPGTCKDKKECKGAVRGSRGCSGGDICCLEKSTKGIIKRFCKPLKRCKGECRKMETGCKLDEKRFKNNKKKKYCDKNSCYCCVKQCKTENKCTNKGGACQLLKAKCDGKFLRGKKYCTGKKCGCCVPTNPPTDCFTKTKCLKKGGTCQSSSDNCKGIAYSDRKYCKGKNCVCCVPGPSPPKECAQTNKCDYADGVCIDPYSDYCADGEELKYKNENGKKYCKKKCGCCVPKDIVDDCEEQTSTCKNAKGTCQPADSKDCDGEQMAFTDKGELYCKSKSCVCCVPKVKDPSWSYKGPTGPPFWKDTFKLCGGKSQSPIDIVTASAVGKFPWSHFTFTNYDVKPNKMTLLNNGHGAQVTAEMPSGAPTVKGGELDGEYTFAQFHFHWGSDDTKGSEHTVDKKKYPAELHLVHYKTSYGDIGTAIQNADGLAVLGIFLEISPKDNDKLDSIINGLQNVLMAETEATIPPFKLEDLLPTNVDDFYRYSGSLTTPTCNEIVTWTVFKEAISISSAQVAKFRTLLDKYGDILVDTFRPVQPLNGRKVYKQAETPHWSYSGKTGPEFWSKYFPICGNDSQSPIDIVAADAKGDFSWIPFHFEQYDATPDSMTIKNNGHSAQVTAKMQTPATIAGGYLDGKYTFLQFHLHWGSDDTKGSEHTIDGKSYPAELHLVHYKTEYGDVVNALKNEDGLAVLGMFLQIDSKNNPKLENLVSGLSKIKYSGSEESITPFKLQDLLPTKVNDFWRYQGSLTTPTCNEIVTWTVFKEPLLISSLQMSEFRKILDDQDTPIVDNFRPVQPLNGRQVKKGLSAPHWSYAGDSGPSNWSKYFPICGAKSQSPINIVTADAKGDFSWSQFRFGNYDVVPTGMKIKNNGHTAQVTATTSSPATVIGGSLGSEYTFLQFHFHWGRDDTVGSEHTVDGKSYPNEVHLVHYKSSYGNISEALKHADGLAVLGIFLKITATDNTKLNSIINGLSGIKDPGKESDIPPFALKDLLPANVKDFYRYSGSLTTPTCNEIVTWTVFKDTISISSNQMKKFREIYDEEGKNMVDNFRPVQPLNGRSVMKGSKAPHWSYSGSDGPDKWSTYFALCAGMSQSPIDIVTGSASGKFSWTPFNFENYDAVPTSMNITNNGHTAQVTAVMNSPATIQGGELVGEYTFLQFHLHWGANDAIGSEHTVDGKSYPNELHLVHYKTSYGSVGEAIKNADGLAVLGIFFKIVSADNPKLKSIIEGLAKIKTYGSEASITPFALRDLLPANVDDFYRYSGSLTTPTCNEVVTWTVFKDTIEISAKQMNQFRMLLDKEGLKMVDNFRPVQPLNGRKVSKGTSSPHWTYSGATGPSKWSTYFPLCGGKKQSPIDIVTASTEGKYSWTHFNFKNYNAVPTSMSIYNNGHSAQVTAVMTSPAAIQGGDLDGEYTFLQFHFHWGASDSIGSEHTVDGKSYPNELHLVHYKSSYGDVGTAIQNADGLAVLGIFLEIDGSDNPKLNSIVNGLASVKDTGSIASITPFALKDLLPENVDDFYRYIGSLTTPTCNEVVTWTVFKDKIKISAAQMAKFRALEDVAGHKIVDNFRPVQPLNGRKVYKGASKPHWTYSGSTGPSKWSTYFPLCGDKKQSPIDIVTASAEGKYSWTHFNFKNYNAVPTNMSIYNNGHSAQVTAVMTSPAAIQGGDLDGEYTFLQFHFHWGANDSIGSEHTVDGKSYPNELHLVHYKSSYGDVGTAIQNADGLAVLGIFLEIDANNNTKLDSIIKGLASIKNADSKASITPFALKDLLPANVDDFYRYSGSLTTPTCNEVVTWTVFKDKIKISAAQMKEFRLLEDVAGHPIVDNFRPVQPLNGRKVYGKSPTAHWSYEGKDGPSNWKTTFPLCGGTKQSPINIVTASVVSETSWTKFTFTNYDAKPTKMEIYNNGHTAQASIEATSLPKIQGGNLTSDYTFAQFHFHWGASDTVGSEHTVDGVSYPNELHLVHYKSSYGSLSEAIKNADGLAVLGIMFKIDAANNTKLNPIISGLEKIINKGDKSSVTPFALQDLLPTNRNQFYRYQGSLTTPTCNEIVTWTVFKEPITISASQMTAFRMIEDAAGYKIVDNFRPVQALNGRTVNYANLA